MTELKSFISQGYKYIYSPHHPNKVLGSYMAEHRLIMEKKLMRFLNKKEIVHHINKNTLDNRPENLIICTQSQHCKLERFGTNLKGKKKTKEHLDNWKKSRWGDGKWKKN